MTFVETSIQEPTSDFSRNSFGGMGDQATRTLTDPAFRKLVLGRRRLGGIVVGIMVVVYFGYILALAFAPSLLQRHITPVITTGFPLGLGVMVITFLLVALYVQRSSSHFEALIVRMQAGTAR